MARNFASLRPTRMGSDGQNRTDQVLMHPHSPGHAVHDDADFSLGHFYPLADADYGFVVSMYKFRRVCKWKRPQATLGAANVGDAMRATAPRRRGSEILDGRITALAIFSVRARWTIASRITGSTISHAVVISPPISTHDGS